MSTLLYINSDPKPESQSFSRRLERTFLDEVAKHSQTLQIKELNLYDNPVPLIDAEVLGAWEKMSKQEILSDSELDKVGRMEVVLEEFMAASHYVIVTPMWNFLFPPRLKSYIDCLVMAGKTFKFTSEGAVGLLENKKMVHIQASGSQYTGTPFEKLNHGDAYLRDLFGFLGITDYERLYVENTHNLFGAKEELEKAKSHVGGLVQSFIA